MRMLVIAGLGLATLLSACAPTVETAEAAGGAAPARADQCFNVRQVINFSEGRPDQIFLRVGRSDVYELNAAAGCSDLDFAVQLSIVPDLNGVAGGRLCTGDWARVNVPNGSARVSTCRVRVSHQLTAEQIAALPPAHRP